LGKHPNSEWLYAVVLDGVLLYLALDVVAQLLPPHYNPLSQPESDLAVGPFGYIMTINFLNRGLLSLGFLFALHRTIRDTGSASLRPRNGYLLFGAWSVGSVLLAIFPTDVPPTPVSWHGAIHLVVAVVAFLGGSFGALSLTLNFRGSGFLERVKRIVLQVAILAVVLCLVDLITPFLAPRTAAAFGGLFERLFLGALLFWIAAISASALRHGIIGQQPHPVTQVSEI
jgi:hypothetical protein